jgi:hypothetical protein
MPNCAPVAGTFNQDPPHGFSSRTEEVGAVGKLAIGLALQSEPRVMHQSGRSKRLAGKFVSQFVYRKMTQFVINDRHQFPGRRRSAGRYCCISLPEAVARMSHGIPFEKVREPG